MGGTLPLTEKRLDSDNHEPHAPDAHNPNGDDDGDDATEPIPPPKKLPPVILAVDIGGT
jgi:hypothetical protein